MLADASVAPVAALVADRARAAMLLALAGGGALPACDLALRAGVKAPTASAHLARLVAGGLLAVERRGRHALYRLASPQVAHVLEALSTLAPPRLAGSFREGQHGKALRVARSCYDHLAGQVGVGVTASLLERESLLRRRSAYILTPSGERALRLLGVNVEAARNTRRSFARPCLDWSERRHHVAGALGAGLLEALLRAEWLRRSSGTRALVVTERGWRGLGDVFGVRRPA